MIHEETKAPFAVYYSYQDQAGEIGGGEEYYKCYYPFLDYSPAVSYTHLDVYKRQLQDRKDPS